MKLSFTLFLSLLILALPGCFASREARIESDYSYTGNFRYSRALMLYLFGFIRYNPRWAESTRQRDAS